MRNRGGRPFSSALMRLTIAGALNEKPESMSAVFVSVMRRERLAACGSAYLCNCIHDAFFL